MYISERQYKKLEVFISNYPELSEFIYFDRHLPGDVSERITKFIQNIDNKQDAFDFLMAALSTDLYDEGFFVLLDNLIQQGVSVEKSSYYQKIESNFNSLVWDRPSFLAIYLGLCQKKLTFSDKNAEGVPLLHVCIKSICEDYNGCFLNFVLHYCKDFSVRDSKGDTVLHCAVVNHRCTQVLKKIASGLLEKGFDCSLVNDNQQTVLHLFILNIRRLASAKPQLLFHFVSGLSSSFNINQRDVDGYTALYYAAILGQLNCVDNLLDLGAYVDDNVLEKLDELRLQCEDELLSPEATQGDDPVSQYEVDQDLQAINRAAEELTRLYEKTDKAKQAYDADREAGLRGIPYGQIAPNGPDYPLSRFFTSQRFESEQNKACFTEKLGPGYGF